MADPTNTRTVIGPDTHIKGEMTFEGAAELLGTFEGTIESKGELHVAEGANCKAQVEAQRVTINGSVQGDLTARDRAQLTSKANVKGDLVASKLVVEEGAVFVGHCTVGPDASKAAKPASGQIETKTAQPAKPEAASKN